MRRIDILAGVLAVLLGTLVFAADSQFIVKDYASITPYATVTKSYTGPVKKIIVYNPNSLNVLMTLNTGVGDKTLSDTSVILMRSTDLGHEFKDINLTKCSLLLQGYTDSDTGTVPCHIYK